jgi:hypothetical protein
MNLFEAEYNKERDSDMNALSFRNKRRNLRELPQTQKNKTDKTIDAARKALLAGKRVSKNGKIYWESRANRTDQKGKNI